MLNYVEAVLFGNRPVMHAVIWDSSRSGHGSREHDDITLRVLYKTLDYLSEYQLLTEVMRHTGYGFFAACVDC
jgi:hypothetical protein